MQESEKGFDGWIWQKHLILVFLRNLYCPQNTPDDEFRDTHKEKNISFTTYWHCLHYSSVWWFFSYLSLKDNYPMLLWLNSFKKLKETQVSFTMQTFKAFLIEFTIWFVQFNTSSITIRAQCCNTDKIWRVAVILKMHWVTPQVKVKINVPDLICGL